MIDLPDDQIRKNVRSRYGSIAQFSKSGCGCSTSDCCRDDQEQPVDVSLILGYSEDELSSVPQGANLGLGCGNPIAIASLKPGEVVLDLGSGGGLDCFLAARAVDETGRVIGVDMTPEMVELSRNNARKMNIQNVEFRLGEIEHLPVADNTIDVIISNCVINLSPQKEQVFSETFRVLKPGGRLAISDVVATAELSDDMKKNEELLASCITGASLITDLANWLRNIGFDEIQIKPKDESKSFIKDWVPGSRLEDYVVSALIEAKKPSLA